MKRIGFLLVLAVCLTLLGCSVEPEEFYSLPGTEPRLQARIDQAMVGKSYCAPVSGENRGSLQRADLNGDGEDEYLLFARENSKTPLQILIFGSEKAGYAPYGVVSCTGENFGRVEYVQLDGEPGLELVFTHTVGQRVQPMVSVCDFTEEPIPLLDAFCYSYTAMDMNGDGSMELALFVTGQARTSNATVQVYDLQQGELSHTNPVDIALSQEQISCLMPGKLQDGGNALYVTGQTESGEARTAVLTVQAGALMNLADSDSPFPPLDMDGDGVTEQAVRDSENLIRWYSLDSRGSQTDKLYTAHDFTDGWYLRLPVQWGGNIRLLCQKNAAEFYLTDAGGEDPEHIFTVYTFTGDDREEQAVLDNRFVLYRAEDAVYAARLEVASGAIELSQEMLKNSFHWYGYLYSSQFQPNTGGR